MDLSGTVEIEVCLESLNQKAGTSMVYLKIDLPLNRCTDVNLCFYPVKFQLKTY